MSSFTVFFQGGISVKVEMCATASILQTLTELTPISTRCYIAHCVLGTILEFSRAKEMDI